MEVFKNVLIHKKEFTPYYTGEVPDDTILAPPESEMQKYNKDGYQFYDWFWNGLKWIRNKWDLYDKDVYVAFPYGSHVLNVDPVQFTQPIDVVAFTPTPVVPVILPTGEEAINQRAHDDSLYTSSYDGLPGSPIIDYDRPINDPKYIEPPVEYPDPINPPVEYPDPINPPVEYPDPINPPIVYPVNDDPINSPIEYPVNDDPINPPIVYPVNDDPINPPIVYPVNGDPINSPVTPVTTADFSNKINELLKNPLVLIGGGILLLMILSRK